MRRRSAAAPRPVAPTPAPVGPKAKEAIIEDLFLLNHRDGLLIKHETRRLRPDVDTDILTGMLTAVQQFVKDALRGDDYADLNEMTVGQMHILIGRGKWLVLAARIEGDGTQPWTASIERCIKDMEDHHWDQLEDWDGDMAIARTLTPYLKKLIDGAYSAPSA
jgi:OOP family OmpA-OmpF porin